ncbi:MAG: hypothetical protein ACLTSZ_04975 [Lachnospiraceae bacterium]
MDDTGRPKKKGKMFSPSIRLSEKRNDSEDQRDWELAVGEKELHCRHWSRRIQTLRKVTASVPEQGTRSAAG